MRLALIIDAAAAATDAHLHTQAHKHTLHLMTTGDIQPLVEVDSQF